MAKVKAAYFSSLLFTALALGAGCAHVFALPNKIDMSADDYLIAQQVYRGWSLLAIVVFGSVLCTLWLTILVRKDAKLFRLAFAALACIVGAQVVFWVFTFPANQQTQNWTMLPENWLQLRSQWEYSHAAGAGLNLAAFITLVLGALSRTSAES